METVGAVEPESFDFVHQVAQRLGLSHADALAVLGAWLATYEPMEPARARAAARPPRSVRRLPTGRSLEAQ
jgi:hypothetical protein